MTAAQTINTQKYKADMLCYVRNHPLKWNIPTRILYGENDNLTSIKTITGFAEQINAPLTVMNGGEHWFHTEQQMQFLDDWVVKAVSDISKQRR